MLSQVEGIGILFVKKTEIKINVNKLHVLLTKTHILVFFIHIHAKFK